MKPNAFLLVVVATLAGFLAFTPRASGHADEKAAPICVNKIPAGYRDWRLISVAHEAGDNNDLRAILGNDVAIKAYREEKLPFSDGTIIARLAWSYVPSEENNKVFGREQSFVAGPPTNVQFMIKDSRKYSATGGWGIRSIHRRQSCQRGGAQSLLFLPRTCQSSGLCLHPLRTLIQGRKGRLSS
jgi:hypothetical protein